MEWYAVDPPAQEEHPIRQLDEAASGAGQSEDDWQITANEIATDLNDTDDQADLNAPFTARHDELAPAPQPAAKQAEDIWQVPKGVRSRR